MSAVIKLLYIEYFTIVKALGVKFCNREEARGNTSMTSDAIQLKALEFLNKYRTE